MGDITGKKSDQLVLSAIGGDRPGIIEELSRAVHECGCNILDSRMAVLGGDFALLLQMDGNWNTLAKLEDQLPGLEARLDLKITSHRTQQASPSRDLMPYAVEVVALDQPGIVHHLARFFSQRKINIQEMMTSSYPAAHSGTPMFSVHLRIDIRGNIRVSELREEFAEFCDNLNLDAVIEPVK
jgi:glycine cleavage system transcriptional repressor